MISLALTNLAAAARVSSYSGVRAKNLLGDLFGTFDFRWFPGWRSREENGRLGFLQLPLRFQSICHLRLTFLANSRILPIAFKLEMSMLSYHL